MIIYYLESKRGEIIGLANNELILPKAKTLNDMGTKELCNIVDNNYSSCDASEKKAIEKVYLSVITPINEAATWEDFLLQREGQLTVNGYGNQNDKVV